ncbi:MAG: error-prone DNA polymerase, partial [Rhodospirillaceae bacterium]|nr:error-prone DNA polymerase [Rhodospirillaceae bacterium]
VRAHVAAKAARVRLLVGARLDLQDGPSLLCYPRDRAAYGRLCRLLTLGQRRTEKGRCLLYMTDVIEHAQGQILIALAPTCLPDDGFAAKLRSLKEALEETVSSPHPLYLACHRLYRGDDRARLVELAALSHETSVPLVATNNVHYHVAERRPLQDVLTAIREHTTVQKAGYLLNAHAERHLKDPAEMARLFADHTDALARTVEITEAVTFSLDELRYEYPDEPVPEGKTAQDHLTDLAWKGAAWRFPKGIPDKIKAAVSHELALIDSLDYARYFLTVHDIVRFARSRSILCQGRGSAANSAVCYCLDITAVDPTEIDLLFERFVSAERKEPPDIDVDFEHERREEVIQYIYRRYGRDRAGLAATVISYRARSAVREVGKAMGLSEDTVAALAGTVWDMHGETEFPEERVKEAGLDPADSLLRRTVELAADLIGFPRHLSQHVGGFVLTRGPLSEMVPIGNAAMEDRTVIEWDKDDLQALGLLKVDVLGLGMLTCIRKGFDLLERHKNIHLTLATVPREDPVVYDMLCRADSLGVFQVESRAQMNMLPRLKPRRFYDLVIEVAIVRPGPIQGDMVHPYLRRRDGIEEVIYPAPSAEHGPPDELSKVLEKTLGVPLFQEQAMKIAIEAAKFTPDEANALRHSMATFRKRGTLHTLKDKMVGRMVARGYDGELSERCFSQIEGFGEYGFPESHAASFALLVYVSSWLKRHHPEVFACALLNAQPMGFYAPGQIVRDAREHGVEARAVDANHSHWDNTLEGTFDGRFALRLGMRQVDGMREDDAGRIMAARHEAYPDVEEVWRRAGVNAACVERLAAADAFRSIGLDRRQALWDARALVKGPALPLFEAADQREQGVEPQVQLPAMQLSEHVVADYQTVRLSLKAHPVSFLRERLGRMGCLDARAIARVRDGRRAAFAGIVLVRQRPGSAKGVVFMTIEDEGGVVNAVVWPRTMEAYRKVVMGARLVLIKGRIQRAGEIVHLVADKLEDLTPELSLLAEGGENLRNPLDRADEVTRPSLRDEAYLAATLSQHPHNQKVIPKSRDFH